MNSHSPAMLRATPGRILKQEFLDELNINQSELAVRTGIPRSAINEITTSIPPAKEQPIRLSV